MAFHLLSEPIRRFVRDKRWESLRPIQIAAIEKIMASSDNYILASRTASGKTEAAFLPILSKVNFKETGVQILYISPLIALINDQFYRVEQLCKYLEVSVTRWHGEAKKSAKNHLIQNPNGIVLITPESLEAMFIHKPFQVKHLFSQLKYVVIDEVHSFIGTDRGTQLKSILFRLQKINISNFSIIGLSATIGDYVEAKKFTGNEANTKVLLDRTAKEIDVNFRYFETNTNDLPLDLLKDLYIQTKDNKALIFPNSRGKTEEVAVKLLKISEKVNGHSLYFSHHSSVHKDVREQIEHFAKHNLHQNFCIVCTSTLELGIDIGTVEKVVQIDATYSISSLIQRVGRSGRKDGQKGNLLLYATNPWSLLQSLACWQLYSEGFIEPPQINNKPYNILLHQILSITKGYSGIKESDLMQLLRENFAFSQIETTEIADIIQHLLEIDFLEKIQQEIIIGIEGEKIVNSRDFYSVFKQESLFKVVYAGNTIGEIPFSIQIKENENILLAARIWKIQDVNFEGKKIEVIKAVDGKKPIFFGGGLNIHQKIRQKMLAILYQNEALEYVEPNALTALNQLRSEFKIFPIQHFETERPLFVGIKKLKLFTFASTRINRTLSYLLEINGVKNELEENFSCIIMEIDKQEFEDKWRSITRPLPQIKVHLEKLLQEKPNILSFAKWTNFLPVKYQITLLKELYFDFEHIKNILSSYKMVVNSEMEDFL